MSETLLAKIILPSGALLETEATMVTIPGSEGVFGVLLRHAPLVSSLDFGVVTVSSSQKVQNYFVYGGIAQVSGLGVNIISEFAVDLSSVSADSVRADITDFEKKLSSLESDSVEAFEISDKIKKYQSLLNFL
jgi:F-type H+-transporting ATPase subunit epsilon